MTIDRTHRSWGIATTLALIATAILYAWYANTTPGGPRGGTAIGLTFGIAGYALMLFAGLLGARKSPCGASGEPKPGCAVTCG
jgi:hypothetical protein